MKINNFFKSDETYIIAEVSQNHDGSLGQAHAFIDAIAETGADAVKFQTHIADAESTPQEPFRIPFSYCDNTRYDYWKRMEFSSEQWKELYTHAMERKLDFLSSPFSIEALNMLDEIGVPAWKLGSGEVFNNILLEKALVTGKPILLSTGLSTWEDIEKQIEKIKTMGNELLLFECTTQYPSNANDINIKNITKFIDRFDYPIGISDHSGTIYPALSAITLGARAVEVHVTMSRYMFGPDVSSSVTMSELKQIVDGVKFIQKMRNCKYEKEALTDSQEELKIMFSKSLYTVHNVKKGDILTEKDIAIKKPFQGIAASQYYNVVGRKVLCDLEKNSPIEWENIR